MTAFGALLKRDLRLSLRQGGGGGLATAFFVMATVLIPFGVGPEPGILSRISGGVIWVGALLASLLSLDRLFQADFEDGSLDGIMLTALPLEVCILAKTLTHWLTTGLVLTVTAPLLGIILNLPSHAYGVLVFSLLIGTPALSLIGAVGAGLTVGVRRGGLLLPLLVLPLCIPTLIFGASALEAATVGLPAANALILLGATTLFTLAIAPFAAATALRSSI